VRERERELRKTANKGVNEIVWEWIISSRVKNHLVSGPMVQEYAKKVAKNWERLNSNPLMDGVDFSQNTSESL
jgi:hypothetical protein